MARRVFNTGDLVREANTGFYKLAAIGAAITAVSCALAVVASYLPTSIQFRDLIALGALRLAVLVPSFFYVVCLLALLNVARSTGQFLWRIWIAAAFATAIWPFVCLLLGMLVLGGVGALDLSTKMQRTFLLGGALPAIQLLCWSGAAVFGRFF